MDNTVTKGKVLSTIKRYFFDAIIPALIATIIVEVFKTYVRIGGWISKRQWDLQPIILITISIGLIIIAVLWLSMESMKKKTGKAIPIILIFLSTVIFWNSLHLPVPESSGLKQIASQQISPENLQTQDTIDIFIQEPYRSLVLEVECPEEITLKFPEMELEKISLLRGDWESLVDELTVAKLSVPELEAVNVNRYYYRLQKGRFTVQINGVEVALNENDRIRINLRNYAELDGTMTLRFWGSR